MGRLNSPPFSDGMRANLVKETISPEGRRTDMAKCLGLRMATPSIKAWPPYVGAFLFKASL